MKLLINKIKLALQKRFRVTQNKKSYAAWAKKGYLQKPEVSVILQSHNKSLQIAHIIPKLRQYNGRRRIGVGCKRQYKKQFAVFCRAVRRTGGGIFCSRNG